MNFGNEFASIGPILFREEQSQRGKAGDGGQSLQMREECPTPRQELPHQQIQYFRESPVLQGLPKHGVVSLSQLRQILRRKFRVSLEFPPVEAELGGGGGFGRQDPDLELREEGRELTCGCA